MARSRRILLPWEEKEIAEEIREFFGGEIPKFKPFAVYDEQLDTIRVMVRDCSYCQMWYGGGIFLLEDNYPRRRNSFRKRFVGFEIECVRSLCSRFSLPFKNQLELLEVLEAAKIQYPHLATQIAACEMLVDRLPNPFVELH